MSAFLIGYMMVAIIIFILLNVFISRRRRNNRIQSQPAIDQPIDPSFTENVEVDGEERYSLIDPKENDSTTQQQNELIEGKSIRTTKQDKSENNLEGI